VNPNRIYRTPLLSAFGTDLYTATNGGVYMETRGSTPNRQLVVEWDVKACCTGGPTTGRFQAIFTEGSLRIQTRYSGSVDDLDSPGWIGTIKDPTTSSRFNADPGDYPAAGSGLTITPTGLTATVGAQIANGHPAVTGEALDKAIDVTVSVYAGTPSLRSPRGP
jgi:hypothetical protein